MADFWAVFLILFLAVFGPILLIALIDWRARRVVMRYLRHMRSFERMEREAREAFSIDRDMEDYA